MFFLYNTRFSSVFFAVPFASIYFYRLLNRSLKFLVLHLPHPLLKCCASFSRSFFSKKERLFYKFNNITLFFFAFFAVFCDTVFVWGPFPSTFSRFLIVKKEEHGKMCGIFSNVKPCERWQ